MRFLVLLTLLFPIHIFASDFKVVWWNIGGGNYFGNRINQENCYADNGRNLVKLQNNILELASENLPDVLMFAEMYEGFLNEETLKKISLTHPYSYRFLYNTINFRPLQIAVFSRKPPVEVIYQQEALHWNNDFEFERSNNTNFLRSYQRLTFLHENKLMHIVPLHAVDPWPELRKETNILNTGLSLMFSKNNASYVQSGYLQTVLARDIPHSNISEEGSSLLMIGDFNIPKKVFGVVPVTYAKYLAGKQAVPLTGETAYTFPSANCFHYKKLPKLQIDHAFVAGKFGRASGKILAHRGSDHFPIEVTFKHLQK